MRPPLRHPGARAASMRGLTFIEMLVSVGVGAVVLMGVLTALSASQGQYAEQSGLAGLQASLRIAATQIEQSLARAGYGIDPVFALATRNTLGIIPTLGASDLQSLDGSGRFGSDSLVIFYRDPLFRRLIVRDSASSTALTLNAPPSPGEPLLRGQKLLLLCDGTVEGAYVTVDRVSGSVVTLMAPAPGAALPAPPGTAAPPFNQNAMLTPGSCFNTGTAVVTRVEMRHYFIAWLLEPNSNVTRPALLVRTGLVVDNDADPGEMPTGWPNPSRDMGDAELVALDVEQLQVSYVLHRPNTCPGGLTNPPCDPHAARYVFTTGPDSDRNFVIGDDPNSPGEALADADVDDGRPPNGGARPEATITAQVIGCGLWGGNGSLWSNMGGNGSPQRPPLLSEFANCASLPDGHPLFCGYGAARRFTSHVGNVRMVRYALSARSARSVAELGESTVLRPDGSLGPAVELENLRDADLVGSQGRYHRGTIRGSVALRNMFHRRHFIPPVDATAGLNIDGG
jgi:hypothetical protein